MGVILSINTQVKEIPEMWIFNFRAGQIMAVAISAFPRTWVESPAGVGVDGQEHPEEVTHTHVVLVHGIVPQDDESGEELVGTESTRQLQLTEAFSAERTYFHTLIIQASYHHGEYIAHCTTNAHLILSSTLWR